MIPPAPFVKHPRSLMTKAPDCCLPPGYIVEGYEIEDRLGSGGFSNVYRARSLKSGRLVAIKEFLAKRAAGRSTSDESSGTNGGDTFRLDHSRGMFLQEARVLARLRHPNIVRVRNFLLANDTAYLVMDYEPGENLSPYIKARGGRLSAQFLLTVFPPLLDALELIHSRSLLHLDVKPANIHIRPGGNPLLLDFGAVHQFATTRRHQPGQVLTTGFAPYEQYRLSGYVGPWSDVYSVGATMRTCIEGAPPAAPERLEKEPMRPAAQAFRKRYPTPLLEAIDWAMEIDPLLRPQSAAALLEALVPDAEARAALRPNDSAHRDRRSPESSSQEGAET